MENRRSKITRKIFRLALKKELENHEIAELSVRQICQQADMNRSTFYLHYNGLQDLVEETVDELISHYPLENQYGIVERTEITRAIQFIKENKIVFYKLVHSEILTERLITHLKVKFDKHLFWPHNTKIKQNRFIALMHYVIAGSNELLIYWLNNDSKIPIEELAEMLIKLQATTRDQLNC